MRIREIEAWAYATVDRVKRRQPNEDDRVELKAGFNVLTPEGAARRIAAHVNASHGSNVLWLFGVDEKAGTVPGVELVEYDSWWRSVAKCFDELAPDVQTVNVPVDQVTVLALLVHADRAPHVVLNPAHGTSGGGPVEFEVPWRTATGTRSAHRSDLIRLLVPAIRAPTFEVLNAQVLLRQNTEQHYVSKGHDFQVDLRVTAYVEYRGDEALVLPFHRATATLTTETSEVLAEFVRMSFYADGLGGWVGNPDTAMRTIERGAQQLIVLGPGQMVAEATLYSSERPQLIAAQRIRASLSIGAIGIDAPLPLEVTVHPVEKPRFLAEWQFRPVDEEDD